ncbi:MAG: membrane dipeptidase [Acidobacteria bacterium]|nr:membrane dipeptidase [Acidobacteriota bacterium]
MRILLFLLWLSPCLAQDGRYERLLRDILIFDAHIDTPRYLMDEGYRLADRHSYYELDIPRMKEGKMGAVLFGIYAQPQDFAPQLWLPRALDVLDALHEEVRRNAGLMEFAWGSEDVLRIHKSGKLAALASLEGGHLIADSERVLRNFHRLGVRYMTLAHFANNAFADSMTDQPLHNGVSAKGRALIAAMNRMGMIVDVSHISDKAVLDAVEVSRSPVIASHSSAKAIAPIPRNMPDEVIRAVARNGGVICINFHAGYLKEEAHAVYIRNRPKRDAEIKAVGRDWERVRAIQRRYFDYMPRVSYKELLRHIDHVAKLTGPDHVALGSDFDGVSGMVPVGMEDVSKYPVLVRGLIEMGYSDGDIRKIMGLNLVRVMRENEERARGMQ